MIIWPAIINYHGDDELIYVASSTEWNNEPELSVYGYDDDDILIDSTGSIYRLSKTVKGIVAPELTNDIIPPEELINLVQKHAAQQGQCCIEKIMFKNISEGIQLVASMRDEY